MTRVLFAERISSDRPDSDSIEGQDLKLETRAEELRSQGRKIEVVGKAVDRSVSGDIDMAERPELGQWLTQEGRAQWDELWVTTQDRLSRNDMHFMSLVFKTIEWGKVLIVLDDPALDLTTPEGRAIAHVKAIGPHRELLRIKARCKDSHERRRFTPRWHGGIPPYGYTTERVIWEGGKEGSVLVLDEHMCSVLHEVRRWLVDDDKMTLQACADRLNARGELTGKDLWRQRKKRPINGTKWTGGNLKQLLTCPSNLGIKLNGRKPMHHRDGTPFLIADPVFDAGEWDELQAAIKEREVVKTRKLGTSPLLGVAFCGKCGKSAFQVVSNPERPGGGNRYYRCLNNVTRCPRVLMRADDVEKTVEEFVLDEIGDLHLMRRVWEAGEDFSRELEDLDKMISRLRSDREAGLYDDDEDYYRSTMKGYMERRKELAKLPQKPSGWSYHSTGVTYRQAWEKADTQSRRKILIDAGVKFFITDSMTWTIEVPEDIRERLQKSGSGSSL